MSKLTIVTVVGTRPEIIRLSRLIPRLDASFNHILVHTGQNYDPKLNDIFFEELKVRTPDYFLDVDTSSLGAVMGDTIKKIEEIFIKHKPDGVTILGDTNSAVAALLAKRMHIPVYHMEAGNRSFDENVPEETNRRMVDHVSDFNLVYSEHARRNLISEGIEPRRIGLTGSPLREVLNYYKSEIEHSNVLEEQKLMPKGYVLVSAHRQENVDNSARLKHLLETLGEVHARWGVPVIVSTHPRTRKRLQSLPGFQKIKGVDFHEPFGYFDFVRLQMNAMVVLSDSGSISEEAAILGFPAITIRDSMERPEALETGHIVMTGVAAKDVISGINVVLGHGLTATKQLPSGYEIDDFSTRVVRFIASTCFVSSKWAGLNSLDVTAY